MRTRRLPMVVAPTSPDQSAEVRLLLALVEAVAHILDNNPYANPQVSQLYDTGIYKSAVQREVAREAGQFSPAQRLAAIVAPVNHDALNLNPVDLLLGWWEGVESLGLGRIREFDFHHGLARLSEQEARAWHLKAKGFEAPEIAKFMDGSTRRTKQFGISIRTVEDHVSNGRKKLEALRSTLQAQ